MLSFKENKKKQRNGCKKNIIAILTTAISLQFITPIF